MNNIITAGKHLRTYNVQYHSHKHWELIYCTSGKCELDIDTGEVYEYGKNEILAVPPNVVHSNKSIGGFTNIFLTIADATFPFKSVVKIVDDSGKNIQNAFSEAYFYSITDIDKRELILSALGELIVSYLIAFYSHTPYSKFVEDIKTDIIKNFSNADYKVENVLAGLPASYDYLRKLFKKEIGITPLEYLTATRMKLAEKLLRGQRTSGYNISEISEMCGFADALYFSRVFKKFFGVSPLAYSMGKAVPPLVTDKT